MPFACLQTVIRYVLLLCRGSTNQGSAEMPEGGGAEVTFIEGELVLRDVTEKKQQRPSNLVCTEFSELHIKVCMQ